MNSTDSIYDLDITVTEDKHDYTVSIQDNNSDRFICIHVSQVDELIASLTQAKEKLTNGHKIY